MGAARAEAQQASASSLSQTASSSGRGASPWRTPRTKQAELLAATYALDSLPDGQDIVLIRDSKFVVKGFNEYLPKWRERGWHN
jgi:ribonuclease HI